MNRKNVKGLICMALVTATVSIMTIPVAAQVVASPGMEYRRIFKEESRGIASYEQLRGKWLELLTGNSLSGLNDVDAVKNIKLMDENVKNSMETADITDSTDYIWNYLVDSKSKSATITAQFKRIKEITVAYKTKDSKYYNNTDLLNIILNATEKMYTKHYNEGSKMVNNWWDWQIGTPKEVVDILVLLNSELGSLKEGLIRTIDRFIPDATKRVGQADSFKETGANLIDKALIVAVRGIAEGNDERVEHAAKAIEDVFPYVIKGDGFYTDGSFLQHGDIAYTGSYGAVLLNGLSNCLFIIQDTEYKINTKDYYNLFSWMKDSYEPIMAIGGNVMDNVRGRAISRMSQQGDSRGKFIISSMLRVADIAPNKEAESYIKSITKRWIKEGSATSEDYFIGLSTGEIANMKNVLNDSSIEQSAERNYYKQFYYMDRAVSNRANYNFTVSMSSNRIANHEDINGESTKAWYTGQGMTQLYTKDLKQYNEDFWPTVDPYRLPGVTSDGQTRKFTDKGNSSSWAGGTTVDGVNGTSGMEILPTYRTINDEATGMSARKSWFMFENEIVSLGSNISSKDKDVETIIDNRKLNDSANNKFLVDGKEETENIGDNEKIKANWAHLEGNVSNSDIGYVFPKEIEITTKRETRTHAWDEINTKAEFTDHDMKTKSYLSLAIDHGTAPDKSNYEYIILPNATVAQTEEYSKKQPIKVLENTDKVHAVYHEEEKIYAINVFEPGKISDNLEVDAPVSMMIKEEDGGYKVSVSNPTKTAEKVNIILKSDLLGDFNVSGDGVTSNSVITIDTSKKSGESHNFIITPKKISVENIIIDKSEVEMTVGDKAKLTATINPENATDKKIIWSSSNEEIAKIDSEGNVVALKAGEVEIKASADEKEGLSKIIVKDKIIEEDKNNSKKPDENKETTGKPIKTGDIASLGVLSLTMATGAGALKLTRKKKQK